MSPTSPAARRAEAALKKLRKGIVVDDALADLAAGVARERKELVRLLWLARQGPSSMKLLRASSGSGRTVFARLIAQDARALGFVTSHISLRDAASLADPGALYRALVANLRTTRQREDALPYILTKLGKRAASKRKKKGGKRSDPLARLSRRQVPAPFGRAVRELIALDGDKKSARSALIDWMKGGSKVPPLIAAIEGAGVIDADRGLAYASGLAEVARAAGYRGLMVVVDDLELLLELSETERELALEHLHKIVDDVASERRMFWLLVAAPALLDSIHGIRTRPELHRRLKFVDEDGYQSPRQPQLALPDWSANRLRQLGASLRELFPCPKGMDPNEVIDDDELRKLARRARWEAEKAGTTTAHAFTLAVLDRLEEAQARHAAKHPKFERAPTRPDSFIQALKPPEQIEGEFPEEQFDDELDDTVYDGSKPDSSKRVKVHSILSEVLEGTHSLKRREKESTLGRYDILEHLGSGAGGLAFRARDPATGDELVLKVLAPALANNETAVARFARETILARRIHHPGICRVFGLEQAEDVRFIAMEFVRGTNLADLLKKRGPLPPIAVAELGCSLTDALAAAHGVGVLHRDLKPRNVVVRPSGDACILDFGVAISPADPQTRLTMPNVLLGSRSYIAPEVWQGEEATVRSDIFSLGVMLYLALTGRLPFTGVDDNELLRAMLAGAPTPPSELREECEDLDLVLLRALAPKPRDRFPTARALEAALHTVEATVEVNSAAGLRDPRSLVKGQEILSGIALGNPDT